MGGTLSRGGGSGAGSLYHLLLLGLGLAFLLAPAVDHLHQARLRVHLAKHPRISVALGVQLLLVQPVFELVLVQAKREQQCLDGRVVHVHEAWGMPRRLGGFSWTANPTEAMPRWAHRWKNGGGLLLQPVTKIDISPASRVGMAGWSTHSPLDESGPYTSSSDSAVYVPTMQAAMMPSRASTMMILEMATVVATRSEFEKSSLNERQADRQKPRPCAVPWVQRLSRGAEGTAWCGHSTSTQQ